MEAWNRANEHGAGNMLTPYAVEHREGRLRRGPLPPPGLLLPLLMILAGGPDAAGADSGTGPMAAVAPDGGSARARALARLAAREAAVAADEAARTGGGALLAITAPTDAPDEVSLPLRALDELPLSIGVRTMDGLCECLLERGTVLPANSSRLFTTTADNQPTAYIELFLGERPFCIGNRFLGGVSLETLPVPSYRSFVQLEVTLEVRVDGSYECYVAEVEGRALGETYANATFHGSLLAIDDRPSAAKPSHLDGEIAPFSHALAKHLPVLLATRTVRLPSGRDIVIRQHQRRKEENVGTGGVLWEAAIVLADYVCRRCDDFLWPGKRVLELGAGTGLVAIALAIEGAEVCATDGNPKVVEGARRNVELAGVMTGTVGLEVFDWNSESDIHRVQTAGPWDIIVGSDLVYPGNAGRHCVESNSDRPPADETVLALLDTLAGPETEVILALKDRTGEVPRFIELVDDNKDRWKLSHAPRDMIMPEFRLVSALAVLHLRRLP